MKLDQNTLYLSSMCNRTTWERRSVLKRKFPCSENDRLRPTVWSVIVSLWWLLSHPFCGCMQLPMLYELKSGTSGRRLVHHRLMLICGIRLIGRCITLYLLCVKISWHHLFRFAPLIAKTAQSGRIWEHIVPLKVEKIARSIDGPLPRLMKSAVPLLRRRNQPSGS